MKIQKTLWVSANYQTKKSRSGQIDFIWLSTHKMKIVGKVKGFSLEEWLQIFPNVTIYDQPYKAEITLNFRKNGKFKFENLCGYALRLVKKGSKKTCWFCTNDFQAVFGIVPFNQPFGISLRYLDEKESK